MPWFRLSRPSPALVVACLALLIALGGTGYAATALPRGSVGTIQLKNGAVVSAKVKDGSLRVVDLAPATRAGLKGDPGPQGAAGPKGDKGDKGDKGATGDRGPAGISRYSVVEKTASSKSGSMGIQVNCPAGTRALGGGGGTQTPAAGVTVRNSFAVTSPTPGWLVVVDAKTPGTGWSYRAMAVCAAIGA